MPRSLSSIGFLSGAAALLLGLSPQASADTIIYANNGRPGDLVTSGSTDVGATGWSYASVIDAASVGIRTDFARSGNGSVALSTSSDKGTASIMYWTGESLGAFADLNVLSYDWYRSSASKVAASAAPAIGLYVANETTGKQGWLIYELAEDKPSWWEADVDAWVTSNAYSNGGGMLWSNQVGNGWEKKSIADWKGALAGYNIYAIDAFIGQGPSEEFIVAVDNISWGFTGSAPVSYNFEVVPEPSSVVMAAIAGGAGLAVAARRRSHRV